jgi:hypothetical protein
LRRFWPILGLLAFTGVLQTALAAADSAASRACVASAVTSNGDPADCSRSDTTDNYSRTQLGSLPLKDKPPELKSLRTGSAGSARSAAAAAAGPLRVAGTAAAGTAVYLITRRLRI